MAKSEFTEYARAKINLTLRVLGKRADGYHELDSLVVFGYLHDRLTADRSSDWGLEIEGPFAEDLDGLDPNDNLILKAARLARDWYAAQGHEIWPLRFKLEKNLPVASGIGGGSADAAAALRICRAATGLHHDNSIYKIAEQIGADVPACIYYGPTWMSGFGENLKPAYFPEGFYLVLANPGMLVSTAEIFKQLDAGQFVSEPEVKGRIQTPDAMIGFIKSSGNDLLATALILEPMIGDVLAEITETNALASGMSGSGATCYGLFDSYVSAHRAKSKLRKNHPDWWVMATEVLSHKN